MLPDPAELPRVALACLAAFFAGLLDAMAGGGGLIQLPALMALLPEAAPGVVLGTNKAASIWGTTVALSRYGRSLTLPWASVGMAAGAAFIGANIGARLATALPPGWFRMLALPLLIGVAVFVFLKPDWGSVPRGRERRLLAVALGLGLGLYDGIIGPGTGTFLIFAFIGALGLDFVGASAAAKAVNVATNLAALLVFGARGDIRWGWALPMAAANAAGGLLGAKLALSRGAPFVRRVMQAVMVVLIGKLGYDALLG